MGREFAVSGEAATLSVDITTAILLYTLLAETKVRGDDYITQALSLAYG
jgi:hypothetical protein